ncbi:MAG: hypothetical protein RR573_04890 [Oscillospiraceae bacterium]
MRIERNNVLALYKNEKAAAKQDGAVLNTATEGNGKTDRVSFSSAATQKAPISRLAQSAAAEIETNTASKAHLEDISNSVNNGSYYVPTDKLVGAIIDVFG